MIAALALLPSIVLLVWIALRDPKRLRSRRLRTVPLSSRARGVITVLMLLPGVVLIGLGQWPAFLIWFGAVLTAGWLLVQLLARVAARPG